MALALVSGVSPYFSTQVQSGTVEGIAATGGGFDVSTAGVMHVGETNATLLELASGAVVVHANNTVAVAADVTFDDIAGNHNITVDVPTVAGTAGDSINISAAPGAAGSGATPGGAGGELGLLGNDGGAGTASALSGAGANVVINAGAPGATGGFGVGAKGSITIGAANMLSLGIGNVTDNPNVTFEGTGDIVASTGTLDVPAGTSFKVGTTALTTAAFTAVNMDTLLDGSDATALHFHTGTVTSQTVISVKVNAITAFNVGEGVGIDHNATEEVASASDHSAAGDLANGIGIAKTAAGTGTAMDVVVAGEIVIPDAEWDTGVPAATSAGAAIWFSATAVGNLTLTKPSTGGQIAQRCGVLTKGGTGVAAIAVIIGDSQLI